MILPAECFYGLHAIPNAVLALFALWRPEPDVARLAIRVSLVHGEPHIVILKLAVAFERDTSATLSIVLAIYARSEERITTLGAEKVLFVICALPELGVVQSYKALVHDGCLAMIAPRCETLRFKRSNVRTPENPTSQRRGGKGGATHLMIIEMAVRFAIALIRTNILEQIITVTTAEAAWVPPDTHCTDNASDNRATATTARKATPTTRGRCWGEYAPATSGRHGSVVRVCVVMTYRINWGRAPIIRGHIGGIREGNLGKLGLRHND